MRGSGGERAHTQAEGHRGQCRKGLRGTVQPGGITYLQLEETSAESKGWEEGPHIHESTHSFKCF